MKERITRSTLQELVDSINRMMGTPTEPWVKDSQGNYLAQIGNYHLAGAYGGHALHQMANRAGGVRDVLGTGYIPVRELHRLVKAWLGGAYAARRAFTAEEEQA